MAPVKFGSIRQIHARLVSEGYGLKEYTLRRWVKIGRIPAAYSGNKAYISYDSVLAVIRTTTEKSA